MKLTVQIIAFEHESKFRDGRPRVTLRVEEADSTFSDIRIPVTSLSKWYIGTVLDLEIKGIADGELDLGTTSRSSQSQ